MLLVAGQIADVAEGTPMQGPGSGGGSLVMLLLDRGIPLTLLLDLADPRGPQSEDLLHHETSSPRWRRPPS